MDWRIKARAKRNALNELIPVRWRLNSPLPSPQAQNDVTGKFLHRYVSNREIEITESDAISITQHTCSGQWTAEEVVTAFCHRAAIAHQLVSCLHEIFFVQALEDARAQDKYFAVHKKPVGPLHGLPVSLKDVFHVKGVETTLGFVGWIGTFEGRSDTGKELVYESELVRELRNLGAILFCKTSVPHTLLSLETMNNVFGYTWNPRNRLLSAGGSSGGECALIAMRGSPLGIGGDSAGSIRAPASFNGLYGMRVSPGRLPYKGVATWSKGDSTLSSVIGPISHSVKSLQFLIRAVLSQKPWLEDPSVIEMPWRQENYDEILRLAGKAAHEPGLSIGMLRDDGVVQPHPPVRRALALVERAFLNAGHQAVDWAPPSHSRARKIYYDAWQYDGGRTVFDAFAMGGEPISDQLALVYGKDGPREEWTSTRIAANKIKKAQFQEEYLDYWNSTAAVTFTGRPIDLIVAPVSECAATRPGGITYGGYTTAFSVLDYTVVTIPVTIVQKEVDVKYPCFTPHNDFDQQVADDYDPLIFDGVHIGVQLVGRRFEEEKMLAVAEYLSCLLKRTQTVKL